MVGDIDRTGSTRRGASHNSIYGVLAVTLLPGHSKPKKLWMTYFIDCYSRMVMGWMVSVRQSSDAVLEALRDAILHDADNDRVYGGTPGVVMYDNGLTFLAEVVQDAASYLDFRTRPVAPYSPHQDGKVERCHQTISRPALSEIAAWHHGPRDKAGRLYDATPISENELITRVARAAHAYNFERPHGAIGGRTPWRAFAEDGAPLRLQPPERLRFALRHHKIQKVSAHGVCKHGRWYRHVELDTRVGDSVVVAWLRKDERSIDVYTLSRELLCTARPHELLDPEDVVAVKRRERERERNAAQDKRPRTTISHALEAYAPADQPDGLKVTTLPTTGTSHQAPGDTDCDEDALLDGLGLRGRVGAVWPGAEGRDAVIEHYLDLQDARVVQTPGSCWRWRIYAASWSAARSPCCGANRGTARRSPAAPYTSACPTSSAAGSSSRRAPTRGSSATRSCTP